MVQEALSVRGLNPHQSTVLVGLDDGQGILKICATIQGNRTDPTDILAGDDEDDDSAKGRSHYSEVHH